MKKVLNIFNWDLIDIVKVLFGSLLFCFAINIFVVPNNMYNGGVLGLSQLIRSFLINTFSIKTNFDFSGIIYYFINIPLFIIAYKNLGKTFFVRTLFVITIQAVLLSVIPIVHVIDDVLASVLVGGVLAGIGIGMTLAVGASTGGTDIIGLILAQKNNNFSVGKLGLIFNLVIYSIAGILYGIEVMIYSIIYSVINTLMIDKMHNQNISSTAFIFCKKKPIEINNYIKNELNRDFTYWDAKGGYDDSKTYIIYTALTKYELILLEKKIKLLDDHAFIIKSEKSGIDGNFKKKF